MLGFVTPISPWGCPQPTVTAAVSFADPCWEHRLAAVEELKAAAAWSNGR